MSGIGGINQGGFIPPIGTGTATGTSTSTGVRSGTEIDGTQHAGKSASTGGNLPLTLGMRDPAGVDPKAASGASSSLATLGGADVSADIYSFMALFAKMAQSMRDTARMQRTSEMQAQVSALQNAAEQMKETAALRFAAAVTQGAMQIAGGVMQVGMSSASAANSIKGAQMDASGKNAVAGAGGDVGKIQAGNNTIAEGAQFSAAGTKLQGYATASGSIATGIGGIASGALNYAADLSDKKKADLETQAKVHETGVQHANDMMQQMMDVIRDVRDKLQSIQQAAVETNRGIARNI